MELDKAIGILRKELKESYRNQCYQSPGKIDREEALGVSVRAMQKVAELVNVAIAAEICRRIKVEQSGAVLLSYDHQIRHTAGETLDKAIRKWMGYDNG